MPTHNEFENINPDDYRKLDVCPTCGAITFKYGTKNNYSVCVSVLDGFRFHRYGNYNNYVVGHECGNDDRQGRNKKLYVNMNEVSECVKNKVNGVLQQQAVMIALNEFSKPGIRSSFKKSMLDQANKFLNGETEYNNPYSMKQVISILGDSFSDVQNTGASKKCTETSKQYIHVLKFKSGNEIYVNDLTKESYIIKVVSGSSVRHKIKKNYFDNRKDLFEYLDIGMKYEVINEENVITYFMNDLE